MMTDLLTPIYDAGNGGVMGSARAPQLTAGANGYLPDLTPSPLYGGVMGSARAPQLSPSNTGYLTPIQSSPYGGVMGPARAPLLSPATQPLTAQPSGPFGGVMGPARTLLSTLPAQAVQDATGLTVYLYRIVGTAFQEVSAVLSGHG